MVDKGSNWISLGDSGVRFMGEMSAANAHEIKNALAVINENAGLLGDLAILAEKGVALDPKRLKRLASKIEQQVARADEIAKSTNRFAHSTDKEHGPVDLSQSLLLMKTMAMRFATKRHISIEVVPAKPAITLLVQPFMLLHLLWLCLQCAMEATNAEKTIKITMERGKDSTVIRYGPLSHIEESNVTKLRKLSEMARLLQLLNGRIEAHTENEDLVLILAKTTDN